MKRIIQFFTLLGFAILISTVSAKAQTTTSIDADVPFNFNIGQETFASGKYKLKVIEDGAGGSIVTLNNEARDIKRTMVAVGSGRTGNGISELVFQKFGEDRYLTGIALPDRGLKLAPSAMSKVEVTRNTASEAVQNTRRPKQS
jgi:hypothetical protein